MKSNIILKVLVLISVLCILFVYFEYRSSQNIKRKSLQMRQILNLKDVGNIDEILFALDYPDDTLSEETIDRIEKYLCKFLSTQKHDPKRILTIRIIKESNETRMFDMEYGGTDATNFVDRSHSYLFYAFEDGKLQTKVKKFNKTSEYLDIDSNSCMFYLNK